LILICSEAFDCDTFFNNLSTPGVFISFDDVDLHQFSSAEPASITRFFGQINTDDELIAKYSVSPLKIIDFEDSFG